MSRNPEFLRLQEARAAKIPWRKWGPYLSERQWGTVREDYSQDGNAWDYFSHDQSRSRAFTGERTVLPVSAMTSNCSVSAWVCGTTRIRYLRSASSA
jgi:hypothetical protein